MAILSLSQSLIQLREFIISGADTHIVLNQLNTLLKRFRPHTYSDGLLDKNKQLLDELKKTKAKVKTL